ncbi:hypothetical protein K227x_27080 [Rubripirellula lacrimiformis]|uniref:Uncharacterized protein n=1 Tax=Rubripirellula lacrimiformis TaxID=1930273 RepID=A0A517NBB8_9BACT|nr:hypothetical protein [Rubripirellula lacrimiformis]QDT04318.1 hypothetical protein K227x_27080 [Rubripirellula lacrimiformis]
MPSSLSPQRKSTSDLPTRQSLRALAVHLRRCWTLGCFVVACWFASSLGNPASAQIFDGLDAYPPRWHLDSSDCQARVIDQDHIVDGGVDGGTCESITFVAANGTEALLVYPIQPVRPLNDLLAKVSVMSARAGAKIGFRIRYPYLRNPETGRPESVTVYGAEYTTPGEFATIGIGMIERALKLKHMAMRGEYGSQADLSDAFVDGIVINAYAGPGKTALRMDELSVDGLVDISAGIVTGNARSRDDLDGDALAGGLRTGLGSDQQMAGRVDQDGRTSPLSLIQKRAFPVGRITRILQHNGEPLAWVRSLGFDAVLLSSPPNAAILAEANQARMAIYAPPPTSPDPSIEALLEPVAAWYVGIGEALDSRQVNSTAMTSATLRRWPTRWQRPLVAAPSETWRSYAPLLDAIIDDLPPRVRGVRGGEEVAQMVATRRQVGDRVESGVGIDSMPPESMLRQTEAIAQAIGAPAPDGFRWHSMWLQTMRSLESTPAAILFRSTRPLSSGSMFDHSRAMSLSYVNRMVAMIAPWVVSATPSPPPPMVGAPYRCTRLTTEGTDLLIATSTATRGSEVLAGDGETLEILLPPDDAAKTAWRLTHFSAERLTPEATTTGARLQIVSPDAAELIVLSSDPSVGASLAQSASRFVRQAGLDRWQLAMESVRRTRESWNRATAARASDRRAPTNLVAVAEQTLRQAEPLYRAGDTDQTLRMARRADAWALRSDWQLAESLMPDWPKPTSSPPMDFGAAEIQTVWRPLMDDAGWGDNILTSGSLDDANLMGPGRWSFGQRMASRATSEVQHVVRGTYQGPGALTARVTPIGDDPLPGGYEGTVIQIRSPSVRVAAGTAIRIDAVVRTIGFGAPHQGVLVYDSIGGQEMGVLVRGRSDWTPVRLYRQAIDAGEVSVMFELIGAGETTIDDVRLSVWEPESILPKPVPYPIATASNAADPIASDPGVSTTQQSSDARRDVGLDDMDATRIGRDAGDDQPTPR